MPTLSANLILSRCPHCSIANPLLAKIHSQTTNNHAHTNQRTWFIYNCTSCGGIVSAYSHDAEKEIGGYFPNNPEIDEDLPDKAKAYLKQAVESLHAPAGAVMLAATVLSMQC